MENETILNIDKKYVARRIEKILEMDDFCLNVNYLMSIHKYLFNGILIGAGSFRKCNLTRKEKILNGDSVKYVDYHRIPLYLGYDFEEEKSVNYNNLDKNELVKRIANFSLKIWITHPFRDGNTRTVSVFIQKYFKYLGYVVSDEFFYINSEYFRNSLALASYYNSALGIYYNMDLLIKFYDKLLMNDTVKLDIENQYNSKYMKILKK